MPNIGIDWHILIRNPGFVIISEFDPYWGIRLKCEQYVYHIISYHMKLLIQEMPRNSLECS